MYRKNPEVSTEATGNGLLKMLKLLGFMASAATVVDGSLARKLWPSTPNRLIGLEPDTTEALLAFGGLGSTSVAQQAAELQNTFPEAPVAYFSYSTSSVSINALAEMLRAEGPMLTEVSISGHSMGGPLGLEVIRKAQIPGLKLGNIMLHCSPFDVGDARHRKATAFAEVVRWPTGPVGKFGFSMLRSMLERESPITGFKRAKFDATNGCSPQQYNSMVRTLRKFKLENHLEEYRQLVGESTQVTYFMPEDPSADKTVDTEQALDRWRGFWSRLGVGVEVHRLAEAGHADVFKACDYLAKTFAASPPDGMVGSGSFGSKQISTHP